MPPPLDREYNADPNIKASKGRGVSNSGSTLNPKKYGYLKGRNGLIESDRGLIMLGIWGLGRRV